jgi:aflatoxin B1 aldehyde reductase
LLKREFGDAIIIGASSAAQLEENLANFEKGPLPEEVVKAFDEGWEKVKGVCKPYFH